MTLLDSIKQFDTALFLWLNSLHTPWWDTAMMLFTRKESWLFLYLLLLYVIIKNYGRQAVVIIVLLILGVALSDQLSGLLKMLTQRLRPGHEPALEGLVHIVLRKGGLYGFVSSHAANAFFVWAFTVRLFRNHAASAGLLLWALLISYTRIYNGNHYPLDILFGAILGILLGVALFRVMKKLAPRYLQSCKRGCGNKPLEVTYATLLIVGLLTIVTTILIAVELLHKYQYL